MIRPVDYHQSERKDEMNQLFQTPIVSSHAIERMAQRNLSFRGLEYVLSNGTRSFGGGVVTYFLRQRDIPATDKRSDFCTRLIGTAILMSMDGTVVTIWRNRKRGTKIIRRKS